MYDTYGAWELTKERPSGFDCFDTPPDFSVLVEEEDDDSIFAFQDKIFAENPDKEFAFGFTPNAGALPRSEAT